MKRLLLSSLLIALAACKSSSTTTTTAEPSQQPQPVSTPAAPAAPGKVIKARFDSAALGVKKDVVVYLPGSYDTSGKRYPVYYYLHGLGGDETNWTEGGKLDKTADALALEAIVVMPDGDDGFYADSPKQVDYDACMKDGTGLFVPQRKKSETCVRTSKYETYITKDLISFVDATYRTIATREGRAIAGLSMGGFGALHLAMRHPDLFAAAASHSGVDALLYGGPIPYAKGKVTITADVKTWGDGLGPFGTWIRGIFGPEIATWRSYDPAALVAKLDPKTGPAIYLDCGTEDEFLLHNGMQYVHDLLLERGIEHAYYIGPGRHNFEFWAVRVKNSLEWLRTKTTPAR
ncbi:MAG: esterase family protein [Myxococcota bacterium]|nr:esterase family protein [Myxococcota bacterium]